MGAYNRVVGQGHPDFENALRDDCGIVQATLGADGLPVCAAAGTTATTYGKSYFDMWYRDTPGLNLPTPYTT